MERVDAPHTAPLLPSRLCLKSLVYFRVSSTDSSRSNPAPGTHENPQAKGLQLPEGHQRHSGEPGAAEQGSAARRSSGQRERAARTRGAQQQQQQPKSGEPPTVMPHYVKAVSLHHSQSHMR